MKVFTSLEQYIKPKNPIVAALGNFDGVHLGHQQLIKTAKNIAQDLHGETLVFTFFPHPQLLFNKSIKMLNSLELKLKLIQSLGIENVLIIPFTKEIAELTPLEFVNGILGETLHVSHVVAGFNYSFGHQGKGKAVDLIKLASRQNIQATIMEPFYINGELVSSTKIRHYLQAGSINHAARLLGYQPVVAGRVIEGNKIGRQLGFPTANLDWDRRLLIPANGVYAVKVKVDNKHYFGVLNIGSKPTVSKKPILTMEVNILGFSGDIYEKDIEVTFFHKLRDEIKFSGLEQLKKQISHDINHALEYFKSYNWCHPEGGTTEGS